MICLYELHRGTAAVRLCGRPAQVTTVVTRGAMALANWRDKLGFMPWARPMLFGTLMQVCYCPRHIRFVERKLNAVLVPDDGRSTRKR